MPIILKSGSLNFLKPSGPVQACNGIALPLPLPCNICVLKFWKGIAVFGSSVASSACPYDKVKGKGKGHPCTGTEALYRPYCP